MHSSTPRRPRLLLLWVAAALILALALIGGALLGRRLAREAIQLRLRGWARAHHMTVRWTGLRVEWPLRVTVSGLQAVDARFPLGPPDTLLSARRLAVDLSPLAALRGRPEPRSFELEGARVHLARAAPDTSDTASVDEDEGSFEEEEPPLARRVRGALAQLRRTAARPPRLRLKGLVLLPATGSAARWDSVALDSMSTGGAGQPDRLLAAGRLYAPVAVPFNLSVRRGSPRAPLEVRFRSDPDTRGSRLPAGLRSAELELVPRGDPRRWFCRGRLSGLRLSSPRLSRGPVRDMDVALRGELFLDRKAGIYQLADSSTLEIGGLPLQVGFEVREQGPVVGASLRETGWSAERIKQAIPPELLGPLERLPVRGSFDYRLAVRLDLSQPESVQVDARVRPRDLRLTDGSGAAAPGADTGAAEAGMAGAGPRGALCLGCLDAPFLARIHLPHDVVVERELGASNPNFVPLGSIDSTLVRAVVASEDGTFYQHHGISVDALREALAHNLRRDTFARGAGTISMQVVRNLWLGHERNLARKLQEIALTWLLEHEARVPKSRLLEIYLNIIEWGPGVQGAQEASRFYFAQDASHLSLDESLFLASLIPQPEAWKSRFDSQGMLRRGARFRMRAVARRMRVHGWLPVDRVPALDSLAVTLRGAARTELLPALTSAPSASEPSDSLAGSPKEPEKKQEKQPESVFEP